MELTQGNAARRMARFTLPIIVINVFGQLYSLVDSVIVAQFAGDHTLSVLAAVNGCMTIGYCLVQGAAGACHIVLANHYGAQRYDEFRDAAHTMRLVMALFSSLVAAAYILLSGMLLRMMQVPAEIFDESRAVLWIYALNLPPMGVDLVSGAVMNGSGNSKAPMLYGAISQVTNLVLDYFAVAVWGLGVMGAAAASLFSISAETVWMLYRTEREFRRLGGGKTVLRKNYAVLMAKIGLPSIAQRSVLALGAMVLQTLVNSYGTDGINSYTAANTISSFLLVPVLACCTGFETFAAQNLGAGKPERVQSGWRMLLLCGLWLDLALTAATLFGADALTSLYLPDRGSAAFALARSYLLLLIPNYFLQFGKTSLEAVFKAHLNIPLVTVSAILSLAVRVALGYALAPSYGLAALAWSTNIGSAAALLFCLVLYRIRFHSSPA